MYFGSAQKQPERLEAILDSVGSLTGRRFRYNRDNQEKEHTDKPTERQRNRRNDVRVC